MKQQNLLISFLQVFGIILVVVGHSFYQHENFFLYEWIYSFHMPLFIFISGYLLKHGLDKKAVLLSDIRLGGKNGFVVKKIKRLLVPYVMISTLAYFPKILLSQFAFRSIEASWESWGRMLLYPWDNVIIFFWFLPTLFLIFMIVFLGGKLIKKWHLSLSFEFILLILLLLHLFNPCHNIDLLNFNGVVSYLFYFALGYYYCQSKYKDILPVSRMVVITLALSIVLVSLPNFFGKDILTAVNGILLSISLGKAYVANSCKFFQHLFGASYAIYLFSWFPQVLSQQIFLGITHVYWIIGSGLAIATGVYVPLLLYLWINANKRKRIGKVIAFLTGQQ